MTSSSKSPRQVPPPGGADAKAQMYARFIPREEVGTFAAWKIGALAPADMPAAAGAAPAASTEPSRTETAEAVAEQLKRARQSGYQDGYRDGLVALEGFKQSFAQQTTAQIGRLLQSVGGQLDGLQQEMADAIAAATVALARQVVRDELAARPETVASVAREALDTLLLSARHIALRVHPRRPSPGRRWCRARSSPRGGARLLADANVARGGCLVESDIGVIDATIEARWRRAAASLGSEAAWVDAGPAAGCVGGRSMNATAAAGPASHPTSASWQRYLADLASFAAEPVPLETQGLLVRVTGLVLEAAGIRLPVGSVCEVRMDGQPPVLAEVVGFSARLRLPDADRRYPRPGQRRPRRAAAVAGGAAAPRCGAPSVAATRGPHLAPAGRRRPARPRRRLARRADGQEGAARARPQRAADAPADQRHGPRPGAHPRSTPACAPSTRC